MTTSQQRNPFGSWKNYREKGWPGILPTHPLTAKKGAGKSPAISGYHGKTNANKYLTDSQLIQLEKRFSDGTNICLRLPTDIIGIDLDLYKSEEHKAEFIRFVEKHGDMPNTWRSSSKPDSDESNHMRRSGIYLFRLPEDQAIPGDPSLQEYRNTITQSPCGSSWFFYTS